MAWLVCVAGAAHKAGLPLAVVAQAALVALVVAGLDEPAQAVVAVALHLGHGAAVPAFFEEPAFVVVRVLLHDAQCAGAPLQAAQAVEGLGALGAVGVARLAAAAALGLLAQGVVLKALHQGPGPAGAGAAQADQLAARVMGAGGGKAIGVFDLGDLASALVVLDLALEAAGCGDGGDEACALVPLVAGDVAVGGVGLGAVFQRTVDLGEHAAAVDGFVLVGGGALQLAGLVCRASPLSLAVQRAVSGLADAGRLACIVVGHLDLVLLAGDHAGFGDQCGLVGPAGIEIFCTLAVLRGEVHGALCFALVERDALGLEDAALGVKRARHAQQGLGRA